LPAQRNQSPDAVRLRNLSKSTLAHDAVATAVLHKHHQILRVGAGLIQFVYKSHLGLATEATCNKNPFSPFFARVFERSVECESVRQPRQCTLSLEERTWSTPTHANTAQLRMRRKDALPRDARRGNEMLVIGVAVTPRN